MTDNYTVDGQMSMFDQDTWCGKMFAEPSVPTKEQTSKRSSRKSSRSSAKMPLMCLCLKRGNGQKPDSSLEWETQESLSPLLTGYMMPSTGAFLNAEKGWLCLPISTDLLQERLCLTLNIGEKPSVPNPTHLSEILETNASPKYYLSARACQGILNRANRRGKKLPEILKTALENQMTESFTYELGEEE